MLMEVHPMREDLLREIETEYSLIRAQNEREETRRREQIRNEQPEIFALVQQREELVFGTLRNILKGSAETDDLPGKMEQISASIRTKLSEKGFPEDYLTPVCRCAACNDTGRTGETVKEPCICLKKAYQQKLREKIGLDSRRRQTFETFDLNVFPAEQIQGLPFSQRDQMKIFMEDCKTWADTYPSGQYRDILMSGPSGLGKTFLLHAMADRMVERDVNVLIISAYRMLEILRKSYFSDEEDAADLLEADVLMIDDVGSEPLMQNVTVEQFFNLLNERQNKGLSTVVSTNLNLEEFRKRYTERIASRLTDTRYCLVLTFKGKDIRKEESYKQ